MKIEREYVICSVCFKKYVGKVPKGGDGTVLFPHLHHKGKKICSGSYLPGRECKED